VGWKRGSLSFEYIKPTAESLSQIAEGFFIVKRLYDSTTERPVVTGLLLDLKSYQKISVPTGPFGARP
jgi:hypothetical protein